MYSIWTARHSWQLLFSGGIDVVHPPLYYVFLKAWMQVSDQLQWLRLSSVLASIGSMICLYQLGKTESKNHPDSMFGHWLLVAYALSGFHLVFDWSVRMYALVTFFSVLTLLAVRKNWSPILIAGFVSVGLLLDYAYFWSLIPIWLLGFWQAWQTGRSTRFATVLGLTVGTIPFIIWQIWRLPYFQAGLNGILWMNDVLYPGFFLPFFLGTHITTWLTIITLCYVLATLLLRRHRLNRYALAWWLVGSSLLLIEATYIVSLVKQPLLHVRSLQIVGLSMTLVWGVVLAEAKQRWIGLGILLGTAFLVPQLFKHNSLKLLTEFYPWRMAKKSIAAQHHQSDDKLYITDDPSSPSPMLYYGLLYSLDGKEMLGDTPTPYVAGLPSKDHTTCKKIWSNYAIVQLCR